MSVRMEVRRTRDLVDRCACVLLLAILSACRGEENHGDREADVDTPRWAFAANEVSISGNGADKGLDRVFGGLLLEDGSVVIGNSGTAQLRFYDPAGRLRKAVGGRGAGPGEFGSINWLAPLPGDSLLAFDLQHQRFSVWTAAGEFARTFAAQAPPGPVRPVAVFADGSVLLAREGHYDPRRGPGVVRDSMQLMRMGRDGEIEQTLGGFAGAEWLIYPHPASFRATQLPFGRSGHVATLGDGFVYGSSESGQLTVHDRMGRRTGTLSLDEPRHSVAREEISSFLEEVQDGPERSALGRHYKSAASGAVFTGLRTDREGNLWVRLSPPPGSDSVKWVVLTPRGEQVGSVRMHGSGLPLDIGRAGMLVRESNADGVQRVSVRKLVR